MAEMDPNALEIRRVYTRRIGEAEAETTSSVADSLEVVVEWAAGRAQNAALAAVGNVQIEVIGRDVNANAPFAALTAGPLGTNTDGLSHDGIYEFVAIALPLPWGGVAGTTYETIARLSRFDAPPVHPKAAFAEWKFFAY